MKRFSTLQTEMEKLWNLTESYFDEILQSYSAEFPEKISTEAPRKSQVRESSERKFKKWKYRRLREYAALYGEGKCEKHEKIYFLKTSKTGSTTIANILMRFGYARPGTNFLLGEAANGHGFLKLQIEDLDY